MLSERSSPHLLGFSSLIFIPQKEWDCKTHIPSDWLTERPRAIGQGKDLVRYEIVFSQPVLVTPLNSRIKFKLNIETCRES